MIPRGRSILGVMAAAACALAVSPGVALAHPLGLPAFAQISAVGSDQVVITWNAAPDDVAALARSLGVDVPPGQVLTRAQDATFSASPALRAALTDKVVVATAADRCLGTVDVTSIVEQGARLSFACPDDLTNVDVTISLLTDLDERYRTLAAATTAEGTRRFMFTSTVPTHGMTLDSAAAQPPPAPAAPAAQDATSGQPFGGSLLLESQFVGLIDRAAGFAGLALGLLIAFGIGALHGLAPGHGKAIAAAYLVGDRGRPRDAVLLGTVVAAMHTWSVLALGFALYQATQRPATALLSAWLQLVSGVLVAVLGGWLLLRRWRERRHAHQAAHDHDHAVPSGDVHPLSWQGLVTLGAAGGLLPSPSAMLVLFTALAVGRLPYGLSLIAAFSVGLAATVAVIGLAVLRGRDFLRGRTEQPGRWSRALAMLPVLAAAAVFALGMAVAGAAVRSVLAAA